jgi:hypothetical protein
MGVHHEDGYSANVEGYFVVGKQRLRLAKTNGRTFVLADPCVLAPATNGELIVTVDGEERRCSVEVPDGVLDGQTIVPYKVTVPF